MGCGISKFDPKEVVEATSSSSTDHQYSPPHYNTKFTTSNCFTGESKPNLVQHSEPSRNKVGLVSEEDVATTGDHNKMKVVKTTTTTMDVKRGDHHQSDQRIETRTRTTEFEDRDDDENDRSCREICRGGSPSFREYCVDSDSISRSMRSEDNCEGGYCKWTNERTINPEKEKGTENEMGRRERIGKGIKKALQRGKSGGVRNFLNASSHRQQQPQQTNYDSSQKLLAKAS